VGPTCCAEKQLTVLLRNDQRQTTILIQLGSTDDLMTSAEKILEKPGVSPYGAALKHVETYLHDADIQCWHAPSTYMMPVFATDMDMHAANLDNTHQISKGASALYT